MAEQWRTVKEQCCVAEQCALPEGFREECTFYFAYCWNRVPAQKTGVISAHEFFYKKAIVSRPTVSILGILIVSVLTDVLEGVWRTGIRQVFVGYSTGYKECCDVYNSSTRRITQCFHDDCTALSQAFPLPRTQDSR